MSERTVSDRVMKGRMSSKEGPGRSQIGTLDKHIKNDTYIYYFIQH